MTTFINYMPNITSYLTPKILFKTSHWGLGPSIGGRRRDKGNRKRYVCVGTNHWFHFKVEIMKLMRYKMENVALSFSTLEILDHSCKESLLWVLALETWFSRSRSLHGPTLQNVTCFEHVLSSLEFFAIIFMTRG